MKTLNHFDMVFYEFVKNKLIFDYTFNQTESVFNLSNFAQQLQTENIYIIFSSMIDQQSFVCFYLNFSFSIEIEIRIEK